MEQTLMIRIKNTDAKKLQDEYEKLVSGLAQANDTREDEDMMASPGTPPYLRRSLDSRLVLSKDMLDEAIPGNIRKAEHFIAFLKRFIEYLKVTHH
jgi:DNA excision repair protein ERCC-2